MRAEIIFTTAYSICLFAFGLAWLWLSTEKEEGKRRRYYKIAALVDLVLVTITILMAISSKGQTFWTEVIRASTAANCLFSAIIMRKKSAE